MRFIQILLFVHCSVVSQLLSYTKRITFYLAKYIVNILALQTLLFSATTTDMCLYEVLKLFPR